MKKFITAEQARKNLKKSDDSDIYNEIMEQLMEDITEASETKTSLKIEDTNLKYQELFKSTLLRHIVLMTLIGADYTVEEKSISNSDRFIIIVSW